MLRLGQFSLALEAAFEAVRSEPLREPAHRAVIEVHLAEGNTAEAVNAFRRYRSLLPDDLGLEPSERTRQAPPGTAEVRVPWAQMYR